MEHFVCCQRVKCTRAVDFTHPTQSPYFLFCFRHRQEEAALDDKISLTIVMFVVFLGDTARGIFFPTLWTYVKAMGGDRITLGYCVGAFSLGRQVGRA